MYTSIHRKHTTGTNIRLTDFTTLKMLFVSPVTMLDDPETEGKGKKNFGTPGIRI